MIRLYLTLSVFTLLCIIGTNVSAQISLSNLNVPYNQDFNNLAAEGLSSELPLGWHLLETGTSRTNDGQYVANNGSSNAGDSYSYGANGSDNRSFGSLLSGTLSSIIGAYFINNAGSTITSLEISYIGKMWRLGNNTGRLDRLEFSYS